MLNSTHCFASVVQAGRSGSQLADSLLPTVCLDGGKETIALGPLTRTLTPLWCPHGRGPIPSQRPHLLLHLTLGVRASRRVVCGSRHVCQGRVGWVPALFPPGKQAWALLVSFSRVRRPPPYVGSHGRRGWVPTPTVGPGCAEPCTFFLTFQGGRSPPDSPSSGRCWKHSQGDDQVLCSPGRGQGPQ